MVSQTSETGNNEDKVESQHNIKSQMSWVKLSAALSAISTVVGIACLLHTVLDKANGSTQQAAVHRLPIMRPAPSSRRLFARRLGTDSSTSSSPDSEDPDLDDSVGVFEYLMDRTATMETFQHYGNGFEGFQYLGSDGHHSEHVDILVKDDIDVSEGVSLALAAQHVGGHLQMQVLVFCPGSGTETEDCHMVMPDFHAVDGSRRLSTAELVTTSEVPQIDMQQVVTLLTVQITEMMAIMRTQAEQMQRQSERMERQSDHIDELLNQTRTAQEQVTQLMEQNSEQIQEVINNQDNNNEASVVETHTHHHCFPLGTMVMTAGSSLPIQDATIGMHLMTSQGLSPFFLQGHADPDAQTSMMEIDTTSNHSVKASPDHYFPLVSGTHMAAQRLSVGDELWIYHEGTLVPSAIAGIRVVAAKGLFNPYTVTGDIVVNGILASSHSSWFLEGTGMSDAAIVASYKALFSPLILLHHLKPDAYVCFHQEIGAKGPLHEVAAYRLVSQATSCLMRGSSVV